MWTILSNSLGQRTMNRNDAASAHSNFTEQLLAELDTLYRTAYYMIGDAMLAEDLVQEVAIKAIQGQHTFRHGAKFRPWIFTILRHTVSDHYRAQGKAPPAVSLDSDGVEFYDAGSLESHFLEQLWDEEVATALADLPDEMRLAVLLADVEGFSYQEIAGVLHWPLGSVMSRLSRGRQKLRQRLLTYAEYKGYRKS